MFDLVLGKHIRLFLVLFNAGLDVLYSVQIFGNHLCPVSVQYGDIYSAMQQVPVVDSSEPDEVAARKMRSACEDYGFLYGM